MEPELHPIEASRLHARRERVFLVFAGLFLGTLTMLNILGITRFIDLSFTVFGVEIPFVLAVGVLPYPVTFLCTDFIGEFYGRRRANFLVLVGFLLNIWVVLFLWLGSVLPGVGGPARDQSGELIRDAAGRAPVFFEIYQLTMGTVAASMIAYLAAQLCDVYLFHFWKRLTRGRHLWLRNNGSTLVSQLVDTTAVILISYFATEAQLGIDEERSLVPQLLTLIGSGYVFKLVAALIDTVPFYIGSHYLARYLEIDPLAEHDRDTEAAG